MKLEVSGELPFPRARVFKVYRDEMPKLVPYLENVRAITVTSRTDEGPRATLINRWRGGGEIPAMVRKVVSDDLMEWDDHAVWNEADFTCQWRTVVPAFKDSVDATGVTSFTALTDTTTRFAMRGEIKVDAGKIRGVPRLLAGTIGPAVESFLVGRIEPNFRAVAKGVERYLREQG